MGWMNRGPRRESQETIAVQANWDKSDSPSVAFIEHSNDPKFYNTASINTPDDELPLIDASVVLVAGETGLLWVVIDDIVYDCTIFVDKHPGGSRVLESFRSSNCSWQFWRFHGKKDMMEFGRPLRIGRTEGIQNRFKEPPRFVGLRKLGSE
ncbi:hypothetical protein ACJZ2D_009777 [Fusarium nematophilum]